MTEGTQGFGINPAQDLSQEQAYLMEFAPLQVIEGTELLDHLGYFEELWTEHLRPRIINGRKTALIIGGATGAGKTTAWSEIVQLARGDELVADSLTTHDRELSLSYICLSSAAHYTKYIKGEIDSAHGHGQYSPEEYHRASVTASEFLGGEMNGYGPKLVGVEVSGAAPVGIDRFTSVAQQLAAYYAEDTVVMMINKSPETARRIKRSRDDLLTANLETLPAFLKKHHVGIVSEGRKKAIKDLSSAELNLVLYHFRTNPAPRAGIDRSDDFSKSLKRELGMNDSDDNFHFWKRVAQEIWQFNERISPVVVLDNKPSVLDFSLNLDALKTDVIRERMLTIAGRHAKLQGLCKEAEGTGLIPN